MNDQKGSRDLPIKAAINRSDTKRTKKINAESYPYS